MTTLSKEFIPYEQALALKELGFDEKCIAADYDANGKIVIQYADEGITNTELDEITAQCNEDAVENGENPIDYDPAVPLYQQAFRWFRQKHNLQAEMVFSEKPDRFYYYIGNMVTGDMDRGSNMSYEEAELACLEKLIEIIKNK